MSNLEIAELVVVIAMLVGVWLMFRRLDRAKRAHEGSKVAAVESRSFPATWASWARSPIRCHSRTARRSRCSATWP